MTPEISVVICTFQRPDLVAAAVASLDHQTVERARFEVIVVDNSPSPTAAAALEESAATRENVQVVHEPVAGLSHARNRGTAEARGRVVLFMDDDALAEPQLLEAHLRAFEEGGLPAATGGRIHLRWPDARPAWVPPSQEAYYSGLDLGDEPQALVYPEYPYGANMAIRRQLLLELGGFATELGRRGRNLLSGEEKDLFLKVHSVGGAMRYVPDAEVHHCILPERESRRWLLRRAWAQGRSDIVMGLLASGRRSRATLAIRGVLHLARAIRFCFAGLVAVADRRERGGARRMEAAARATRWFGASWEGLVRAVGPSPDPNRASGDHRAPAGPLEPRG
jgi:GT2 family glycosyltransferase